MIKIENILIISAGVETVTNNWVHDFFIPGLKRDQNKVKYLNLRNLTKNDRRRSFLESLAWAEKNNALIIGLLRDHWLNDEEKSRLFSTCLTKVNYIIDSEMDWKKSLDMYDIFDLTAVSFKRSYDILSKKYSKLTYLPFGFNPDLHSSSPRHKGFGFFASPTLGRLRYLCYLKQNNIPVFSNISVPVDCKFFPSRVVRPELKILSEQDILNIRRKVLMRSIWAKFIPEMSYEYSYISSEDYEDIMTRYWFSIGLNDYRNTGIVSQAYVHYRLRDVECISSGSIHLTRSSEDIQEYIRKGFVIHTYNNAKDMINTANNMMDLSETECEEIQKNNYHEAQRNTWIKSIESILG